MLTLLNALALADDPICASWTASQLLVEADKVPSKESSGLAVIADGLLTHDDSSGAAELYQFDKLGNFLRTITIEGATNTDWEDLAVAPCSEGECAFIADIGDNDETRDHVTIWRAPVVDADTYTATACDLVYDDGSPHDAEALLLFPDGSVRVVTKTGGKAKVFHSEPLTCDGTEQVLVEETSLELSEPVSGGAVSDDGALVALRGNTEGWVWRAECALDWSDTPQDLLFVGEDQGESIDFDADGNLYSTSEGKKFELHELPCADTSAPACATDCGCGAPSSSASTFSVFAAAALLSWRRRR